MRVIAGKFRGTKLADLGAGDADAHLRPTPDRVRESLFNILENNDFPSLTGAHVLDLFAGTGALGLEALSRGAERVVFVENGAVSVKLLKANIAKCRAGAETDVQRTDARDMKNKPVKPYTYVFLDPPYGKGLGEAALGSLARDWLAEGAVIVWEEAREMRPPPGFALRETRRFGSTVITILTKS